MTITFVANLHSKSQISNSDNSFENIAKFNQMEVGSILKRQMLVHKNLRLNQLMTFGCSLLIKLTYSLSLHHIICDIISHNLGSRG